MTPMLPPVRGPRAAARPARVVRHARVAALLVLAAAGCGGGGDAATPPPAPPPPPTTPPAASLVVAPASDSLTSVHATTQLAARRPDGTAADVVWRSADTTVAVVTQAGRVRVLREGTTTVVARMADGTAASARIVVRQQPVRVVVTPAAARRPLGRTQRFTAVAVDAGGTAIPDLAVAWTTPSAAIATVDAAGIATARAVGADTVRATIAGIVGTAVLAVDAAPTPDFLPGIVVVGAGQTVAATPTEPPFLVLDTIAEGEGADLVVRAADPEIATVAVGEGQWSGFTRTHGLTVAGRRAGTTRLTATASGFRTAEAEVRVTTPRLVAIEGVPFGVLRASPAGGTTTVFVSVADSLGGIHASIAGLAVTARSANPAVADVETPSVSVAPGASGAAVRVRLGVAGRANVIVEAIGHRPDTVRIDVYADGPRFVHVAGAAVQPTIAVGIGLRDEVGRVYVAPPDRALDATISLTQRRPDVLRIPATVDRANLWSRAYVPLEGRAAGVDTVIATLAGYAPDTLIVHVARPRLRASRSPVAFDAAGARTVTMNESAAYYIVPADSTGAPALVATAPVRLRVSSTNPAVFEPTAATVTLRATGNQVDAATVPLRLLGVGTAALRVEDEAGVFPPYTTPPLTVAPMRLAMGVRAAHARTVTLGMGQSVGGDGLWAEMEREGDVARTVRLRSTDPRIVRPVSDTAFGTWRAHFDVVAGDVTGSAWIVASGTGMASDSILVEVGTPSFRIDRHGNATDAPGIISVRLLDQAGNVRSVAEPFEIVLATSDAAVMGFERPTVTFRPGAFESDGVPIVALRTGSALLIVRDSRSPARYDPEASAAIALRP